MKSLKKTFEILEVFLNIDSEEVRGLRLTDLAKLSGINIPTVNRIASSLVEMGYLSQTQKRGKYSLGPKFLYFDHVLNKHKSFKDIAQKFLIKLYESVGETVTLVSFYGKRIYYVEEIPSKLPLRIHPDPISITPLYCSGSGKIFLANMSEQELNDYFYKTDLRSYTENTITDQNILERHLMMVAKEGVAYDDEELYVGVRSVAAGIKDIKGNVSWAVSILGPSVRLTRSRMVEITPEVRDCAEQLSSALFL